jgi:hypothetical protein
MFGRRTKKVTEAFWLLYDEYIKTENKELLPELSRLLSMIEMLNYYVLKMDGTR